MLRTEKERKAEHVCSSFMLKLSILAHATNVDGEANKSESIKHHFRHFIATESQKQQNDIYIQRSLSSLTEFLGTESTEPKNSVSLSGLCAKGQTLTYSTAMHHLTLSDRPTGTSSGVIYICKKHTLELHMSPKELVIVPSGSPYGFICPY